MEATEAAADEIEQYRQLLGMQQGLQWQERMASAYEGMLSQWTVDDLAALNNAPLHTVLRNPDVFVEAALDAYSDYVLDEFRSIAVFAGSVGDFMLSGLELTKCSVEYVMANIAEDVFGRRMIGTAPSTLVESCAEAKAIAEVWDQFNLLVEKIQRIELSRATEQAWDFIGELLLASADMAAQPEVKHAIFAFYDDPQALGTVVGTVAGFVMWQVIEAVVTRGLGKVAATSKLGKAAAAAIDFAL
ncbi:hypothetical protein ACFZAE_38110 [Streptomyces scabiei]|uniref:hypothetical protein n=1 Tax=Streptomyces scabiei TaxID=1930 RepID=UPI0036EB5B08